TRSCSWSACGRTTCRSSRTSGTSTCAGTARSPTPASGWGSSAWSPGSASSSTCARPSPSPACSTRSIRSRLMSLCEASQRWSRRLDSLAGPLVAAAALLVGLASFAYYFAHGLTLAHYDSKSHLVVARRLTDSVDPGYLQMGVHWLPLIHLLYLPFTLFESQYRSGVGPSLVSVAAFTLSAWLVFRICLRATGSTGAGVAAAVVLVANGNLAY